MQPLLLPGNPYCLMCGERLLGRPGDCQDGGLGGGSEGSIEWLMKGNQRQAEHPRSSRPEGPRGMAREKTVESPA